MIQDNLSNPFYFCIRHVTGCSTAGKPKEFLLLSSTGIQLRTTIYNRITYYMCFFIFFLLLIELYLLLSIAVAELSYKDFCFSSGNLSFSFLMFTWKPVIWNHSVLQVLGIRWKWRMLSSSIEFYPILLWLSYCKWSLIILLLCKLNRNYIKENKRSFLFNILFLWTR